MRVILYFMGLAGSSFRLNFLLVIKLVVINSRLMGALVLKGRIVAIAT